MSRFKKAALITGLFLLSVAAALPIYMADRRASASSKKVYPPGSPEARAIRESIMRMQQNQAAMMAAQRAPTEKQNKLFK